MKASSASLFEVYLRLRPSQNVNGERFIDVEERSGRTASPTSATFPASLDFPTGTAGSQNVDDGGVSNGQGAIGSTITTNKDDGNDVNTHNANDAGFDAESKDTFNPCETEEGGEKYNNHTPAQHTQARPKAQPDKPPPPTHITIKPPSYDHRKRAVERFAFTRIFEEDASQRDIFTRAGVVPLIAGVLGGSTVGSHDGEEDEDGDEGNGGQARGVAATTVMEEEDGGKKQKKNGPRDGLLATLGMTGSGKVRIF